MYSDSTQLFQAEHVKTEAFPERVFRSKQDASESMFASLSTFNGMKLFGLDRDTSAKVVAYFFQTSKMDDPQNAPPLILSSSTAATAHRVCEFLVLLGEQKEYTNKLMRVAAMDFCYATGISAFQEDDQLMDRMIRL